MTLDGSLIELATNTRSTVSNWKKLTQKQLLTKSCSALFQSFIKSITQRQVWLCFRAFQKLIQFKLTWVLVLLLLLLDRWLVLLNWCSLWLASTTTSSYHVSNSVTLKKKTTYTPLILLFVAINTNLTIQGFH